MSIKLFSRKCWMGGKRVCIPAWARLSHGALHQVAGMEGVAPPGSQKEGGPYSPHPQAHSRPPPQRRICRRQCSRLLATPDLFPRNWSRTAGDVPSPSACRRRDSSEPGPLKLLPLWPSLVVRRRACRRGVIAGRSVGRGCCRSARGGEGPWALARPGPRVLGPSWWRWSSWWWWWEQEWAGYSLRDRYLVFVGVCVFYM